MHGGTTSVGSEQLKLRFIVNADLRCEPVNVPVEFVADLDTRDRARSRSTGL